MGNAFFGRIVRVPPAKPYGSSHPSGFFSLNLLTNDGIYDIIKMVCYFRISMRKGELSRMDPYKLLITG